MFTHEEIWKAIDLLAQRHGYSASGLAKKAGLDPTTFNKSKRVSADGKPRWPSTESISKLLVVTGETMAQFLGADAESLQKGMAVALQTNSHEMVTGTFIGQSQNMIEIEPKDKTGDLRRFDRKDIAWLAQIIFVN